MGNKNYKAAFISPERLNLPEKEIDPEVLSMLLGKIESGEGLTDIKVMEENGEFYLVEGFDSAMAYAFSMATYIPATLVKCEKPDGDFVRIKNSL